MLIFLTGNQANFDYIDTTERRVLNEVYDSDRPFHGNAMQEVKKAMDVLTERIHQTIQNERELTLSEAKNKMLQLQQQDGFDKLNPTEQETILKTTENIQKIQEDALKDNIGILQTKDGFALIILKENKKDQLTDEDFKNLPKKDQEELTKNLKKYQQKLEQIVISLPNKEQQKKDKIKKETHKILEDTVNPIFKTLEEKWKHNKKAVEHLKSIKAEIISHKEYFTHKEQLTPIKQEIDIYQNLMQEKTKDKYSLTNFEVNIITDNTQRLTNKEGCPVIALDTINYNNLFGKVEYNSEFGSFSTNFTLIKQGALHQANGGYLLMDIRKVLEVPYLWEHLKNALKTKKIQILNHDNFYGYSVSTIDPEPIPLNIKIILIGEPELYYGLSNYDNEFKDLFKIIADFNHEVEYSDENVKLYTSLASSIVKNHNLKHLDSKGLAYFVELGAKLTESQEYLSMEISSLINLLIEANYFATNSNKTYISKDEINKAYKEQIFRSSKYHSYMQKQIQNKNR
jgi:predicted ATP-dependent protease